MWQAVESSSTTWILWRVRYWTETSDASAMEGTDDTARCVRRMEEDTDGNLKCIVLLIACIQHDTSENHIPLFAV